MVELMNETTPIFLSNLNRITQETSPKALLPFAFTSKDLTK
jgi:cytidine deaminase